MLSSAPLARLDRFTKTYVCPGRPRLATDIDLDAARNCTRDWRVCPRLPAEAFDSLNGTVRAPASVLAMEARWSLYGEPCCNRWQITGKSRARKTRQNKPKPVPA